MAKYETRCLWNIFITGIGLVKRIAVSEWDAINQAYTDYRDQEPSRQHYHAKKTK